MSTPDLTFVIPTYRLREVGDTITQYDEHFWRNGHAVRIVVFDDSTPANRDKYFPLLEQTRTHNELFYVGPQEKDAFISYLNKRLRDARLEGIVRNLFRPSYGGNRNCTLMYTLGGHMVSSDDDMRPFALMEDSPESLDLDEVCRGRLHKAGQGDWVHKSFDILAAFQDVLGKPAGDAPENYERGEVLVDTATDLETNATKGPTTGNSLVLRHGPVPDRSVVRLAQTFRSGSNDIDALDFVEMFLADENQIDPDALNDIYVLVNFRPAVTKLNWRMDCGVAGYDNTFGLPPFFPTRLRFEDYIFRLWVQQEGIVSAHVDAAQHHLRSNYMRNPPAAEIFNEEVANLIKRKIQTSVTHISELGLEFAYDGQVSASDAQEVLDKIVRLHTKAMKGTSRPASPERTQALRLFAANLEKAFYGFEPDFFQQNLARIVDDVISVIRSAIELWPTLVEIAYLEKSRRGLPQVRVRNRRPNGHSSTPDDR
jgi:hypothetical protein